MKKAHQAFVALSTILFAVLLALCVLTVFLTMYATTTTLSFETFGGSVIKPISIKVGEEITFPENPEKEGYEFVGWYLSDTFEEKASQTAPAGNITYYAKYEKYPKLTVLSGGQHYLKEGTNLSAFLNKNVPAKNGLVFDYWEVNGQELNDSMCMPKEDITAEAHFKAPYRVELYLQTATSSDEYERQDGGSGFVLEGEKIKVEIPTFEHFHLEEERCSAPEKIADGSGNVFTFYYRRDPVNVTFYNGEESEPIKSFYGATLSLAARFEREGYAFFGWATERGGKAEYLAESELVLEEDVALYAMWGKEYMDGRGSEDVLLIAESERDGSRQVVLNTLFGAYKESVLTFSDGTTGRIENGYYLLSDSGTYAEYLLTMSGDTGSLALDFETGSAIYTLENEELTGTYRYLFDQEADAYTGQYLFESGADRFLFLITESGFLREGKEKGEYCLYHCFAGEYDGSVLLSFDGLGVARYTADGITYTASYRGCGEGEWLVALESGNMRVLTHHYKSYLGSTELESVPVFLVYRADWTGKFLGKNGEYIVLDGYGFRGEYYKGGTTYIGVFAVEGDEVEFTYVAGTEKKTVKFKLERIANSYTII